MSELASMTCVPCRGGIPPLRGGDLDAMKQKLPGWDVVNEHHLHKKFSFPDFVQALAFVNQVSRTYAAATKLTPHLYVCHATNGAEVVRVP